MVERVFVSCVLTYPNSQPSVDACHRFFYNMRFPVVGVVGILLLCLCQSEVRLQDGSGKLHSCFRSREMPR